MTEIRELFHKIGNLHNKISVGAGVTKVELKRKFKDNPIPSEIENAISRLTDLEKTAVEASKDLRQLKDMVYIRMGIDTSKPRK